MNRESIKIIGIMVIAAALFGSVVSGIYISSRDTLDRNERIRLQRAYVDVFDLGDPDALSAEVITRLVDSRVQLGEVVKDPVSGKEFTVIRAYEDDERENLKAVGFRFRGLGFWAPIEGILSLTPDLTRSVDIVILQQQETPGLGGRIEEAIFRQQFQRGLDLSPPVEAPRYLQISSTPPADGSPMEGRHVDAITGATQTCMAMDNILNEHLAAFQRAMRQDYE